MRRVAGLTGDQLATRLGWTRTKVPKLENGRQMPSEADIVAWAEACGQAATAGELLRLLSQAQAVHREWRHKLRDGQAALQAEFDALVRGASRIRDFQIMLIPGLLQTPGLRPLSRAGSRASARHRRKARGRDCSGTNAPS